MAEFTREDVEHLDVLIASAMERDGTVALPGAEHARNKIAREVGIEEQPEGGITWETVRATDYGPGDTTPRKSEYGV